MQGFLHLWKESALTSLGLFWMAFWAFGLGYLISSMIQVFVTQERMKRMMGSQGVKSTALATFFGFLSSSCSFAALSTTRALFTKGAGLIPSLAFLLASTNLVIELGIVISAFLTWQFVVGEYIGGLILILLMWLVVKLTLSKSLEEEARDYARNSEGGSNSDGEVADWHKLIKSKKGWLRVAQKYLMEWQMVWKDVTIGFTVAGIVAAFVPASFFEALFVGAGKQNPHFWEVLLQCLVGPIAAFFTFIGSMGNIPLAAVLFSNGVAFGGIMAFIFSDLVVFPVLRIQASYYGWKVALYILGVFFIVLVVASLILHYGFNALDFLPDSSEIKKMTEREFFKIDYSLFLNMVFMFFSCAAIGLRIKSHGIKLSLPNKEIILFCFACLSFIWLGVGVALSSFT